MRERHQLFRQMRHDLMLHMIAEEKIFYALLVDEDIAEDLALEAAEEHHLVKVLLEELAGQRCSVMGGQATGTDGAGGAPCR